MRTAARKSITCTCICSAGARSDPWFRAHKYQKKRTSDEEEKERAGDARPGAAVLTRAPGAEKETYSGRGKIHGAPGQGPRNSFRSAQCRPPRVVSGARTLSAWLPARLRCT